MNVFNKIKKTPFLVSFILIISLTISPVYALDISDDDDNTGSEPLNPGIKDEQTDEGDEGMVVSAHPIASEIGAQVLKDGGNASDAAVAMQLALNVVEPMMSGIGGGGFMMYYDANDKDVSLINSRERAPSKATGDLFLDEDGNLPPFQERVRSGKSVGVPGTLKGLEDTINKHGSGEYNLKDLLQPAIKLAEEGHEINWSLAKQIENNANKLSKTKAADVFLNNEGEPKEEGELLVQEDLADTFKLIAQKGTDVLYGGEIGQAIVNEVQSFNGIMEMEDLENYELSYENPVRENYKGHEVVTMPPPSSGGLTMLQMLKMAEKLNITDYDVKSSDKYHFLIESMHLAYADRGEYMGDPDQVIIPSEGLLNDDYIDKRISTIKSDKVNTNVKPGNPFDYQDGDKPNLTNPNTGESDRVEGETTHFSVIDSSGNAVSYTTTIEQVFGSGIMAEGIMLNNEMTDFDARPGGANEVAPNRRPLSSMTPTIVLKDNEPYMTVGSPGGTTIITSVTQTILNNIGYGMDIKDSIEEPRIYSNKYPNIRWEPGIPKNVREQVTNLGHTWENEPVDIGNVNSIIVEVDETTGKNNYLGAADSTREGSAVGINSSGKNANDLKDLLEQLVKEEEIKDEEALRVLNMHLSAVNYFEDQGDHDKIIKHMKGFKQLIQKHNESLTKKATDILTNYADDMIEENK